MMFVFVVLVGVKMFVWMFLMMIIGVIRVGIVFRKVWLIVLEVILLLFC